MIDLTKERNPQPQLAPQERIRGFMEISTGYTEDMAIREAMRCLRCRKRPCMSGCPLKMRIPEFIEKVAEGEFEAAYAIIRSCSTMPEICSRVCPQENQCEGHCIRGKRSEPVSIGLLERFVTEWHKANGKTDVFPGERSAGRKVAVIGAGPAGIACAEELADLGYAVSIVDAAEEPGGVMLYGIPNYRLPKSILAEKISELERKGVRFIRNTTVGEYFTTDELIQREGYEAVFIGTGADQPTFIQIPGSDAAGVCTAHAYLTGINMEQVGLPRISLDIPQGRRVAVIGAGNVAMDAARCALRRGAEKVQIVYRRSFDEMPARKDEIREAMEEGVEMLLLTQPVEIRTDESGKVCGMICERLQLGKPDKSGRRQPEVIPDSRYKIECDMVIMALGSKQSMRLLNATSDLEGDSHGAILADETGATSRPGIFAGGDAVTGPATVSKAVFAGKTAAASMDAFIRAKHGE